MKRKIFSKLLMGALLVASVSSFVSCKDYDDDINNLQDQINAKAATSQIESLQSQLTGISSTASSALAKAEAAATAAQAAQNTADKAATAAALAEVKATAEKAGTDAAQAIKDAADAAAAAKSEAEAAKAAGEAAAKAAQEAAEKAIAEAIAKVPVYDLTPYATKAELAGYATTKDIADAIAAATKDVATSKALTDQLAALKSDLEKQIADAKAAMSSASATQGAVDEIWSAITQIDFFVDNNGVIVNPNFLNFQFGKQLANEFGNGKELHAYEATDKPKTYTAGKDVEAENVYFVRVSPVNADLAAADLKLINTVGEDLSEFVNIVAEPYNELLTRAESKTGLWKVTVTLKDGIDRAKLQTATNAKLSRDKKRTISAAVYAIAAGNTEKAASRLAVTSYDLKALTNEYAPTADLDFTVNGVAIADIYNRWDGIQVVAEDGSMEKDSLYWELAWETAANAEKYGYTVPAVKAVTNVAYDAVAKQQKNNYVRDAADVRNNQPKLQVQPEEQIIVKFPIAQYPFVDRFYVQFEKDNAIESAPSEFESWKSYNATGLSQMKKVSERLILTVPSDAAEGDIIGFRVWAVNYDGTLVDPDGKAFYVQVGFVPNAEESDIVTGTYTARQAALAAPGAKSVISNTANGVIVPFDFSAKYSSIYKGTAIASAIDNGAGGTASVLVDPTKEQNVNFVTAAGTTVDVYYLKSDKLDAKGNAQLAANVGEIKYIALNLRNPENVIDGSTIETDPLKIFDQDKHNKVVGYVSFMLKKGDIVPNAITSNNDNKIAWKSGQNGTFYPQIGAAAWNALFVSPGDDEVFDLTTYATGLDTYANLATYKWTISKIAFNATTEADYVQPDLDFGAGIQNIAPTATADGTTSATTGGTATAFDLNVTPTMVKYGKTVKITISDYAGVAGLSRTSLTAAPAAGNPHVYQTLTLNFSDVWNSQTYKNGLTYDGGAVGAAANATIKEQTFYVKNSTLATGLNTAWTNATTAGTPAKVTVAAVKNYPAGAGQSLATIYTTSSNSAYELFYTGAFAAAKYVKFATEKSVSTLAADDIISFYVKSENGAINEYITPAYGVLGNINAGGAAFPNNTAANMAAVLGANFAFTATAGAPTLMTTLEQTLVIKVVDAFGISHNLSIPFELIP